MEPYRGVSDAEGPAEAEVRAPTGPRRHIIWRTAGAIVIGLVAGIIGAQIGFAAACDIIFGPCPGPPTGLFIGLVAGGWLGWAILLRRRPGGAPRPGTAQDPSRSVAPPHR